MKKLFILSIVILIATATFAQRDRTKRNDTTHHVTVVYDFLSKEDPLKILRWKGKKNSPDTFWDVRKLYYGDKVNFKIRVNPFLYDVKVNGENVFDNTPLDTAYQRRLLSFFNNNSATSTTQA